MAHHTARWRDGEATQSKYRNCAVQRRHFRLVNNEELYDHRVDPGETANVIAQHPELVEKMRKFYDAWWEECLPLMCNEVKSVRENAVNNYLKQVRPRKKKPKK